MSLQVGLLEFSTARNARHVAACHPSIIRQQIHNYNVCYFDNITCS